MVSTKIENRFRKNWKRNEIHVKIQINPSHKTTSSFEHKYDVYVWCWNEIFKNIVVLFSFRFVRFSMIFIDRARDIILYTFYIFVCRIGWVWESVRICMNVSFLSLSLSTSFSLSSPFSFHTLFLSPARVRSHSLVVGFDSSQAAQKRNSQNSLHIKTASIECSLTENYGSCFCCCGCGCCS